MVALTFVTGVVDAVGYLGLDRVFTGNMTGNIVILGMGVTGADGLPVLGPAIALAGFTVAAWIAGLALRATSPGWESRVTVLLSIGGIVLSGLAIAAVIDERPGPTGQVLMATATAAVMGQQAMVARALAVRDMTTVVVTSTLTSLAGETWTQGATGALFNRRLAAIAVIFLGALAGAALLTVHLAVPLAVAAAVTFLVVAVGHQHLREPRSAGAPEADVRGRAVL
ncbi:DUF1275 domain-containing protein [Mycolicibacterium sp. 018/SC-01/001]|uniref:YoaK family protein n=1 Tax=Mycolicibacterium sp. 018/SC-01/001 TaxID=2592069 RepID=UPI00117C9FB2|nr:YoaK family protein [Mycolicibacterium sp. 018/SC-01/001]TRW81743.1 DUF1275 domain-containing protein [Mycolicibacterium sp. 018/SC-01/001]